MSRKLHYVEPGDDVHAALKLMRKEQIRRVPVLGAKKQLLGVLSLNDAIQRAEHATSKKLAELSYEDVMGTLKAVSAHIPHQH